MNCNKTMLLSVMMAILLFLSYKSMAQQKDKEINIFRLMERRDLKLAEIEALGNKYFEKHGKGKGSGYKQFQRWLYEQQFHVDEQGYLQTEDRDQNAYKEAKNKLRKEKNPPKKKSAGTAIQSLESSSGLDAPSNMNESSSNFWTEKGPDYIQPTYTWSPGVGRITSIAVNPQNANQIYVTSPGGGLWKTNNGGAGVGNWVSMTDDNNALMDMYAVAIDPLNTQIVYAGSSGGTLIKSINAGTDWTQIMTPGTTGKIWKIIPHPSVNGIVFVAAQNGIFRSTNGGTSWTRVHTTRKEDIEFKPNNPNILYATGNDVQRSTDGGITWSLLGSSAGITTTDRTLVAVTAADPNRVYLVQANGGEFGKFFVSTDSGVSFTTTITGSTTTGTNFFGYSSDGKSAGGQASYDMSMAASQTNASEVHIGGINHWRTINAGTSFVIETQWSIPNSIGYTHCDQHALEYVNGVLYSGSDGGIYKSVNNGDDWTDLSSGLGVRQFYRIGVSKTNPNIFAGGAQDNGSSIHRTAGWIDWLGADGMDTRISPLDSNLIWGTSQNGGIYRTTNGGITQTGLTKPSEGEWVTPLAIESNTNVIYGGWTGVYKSTNNGTAWTKISGTTITTTLSVLAVAPSNPAYIYASKGTTLYTTSNGGTSWSTIVAPANITSIAVSPLNPAKIWMTGNTSGANRVMVSTNGGVSFTSIASNLPAIAARTIVVDENAEEGVYVGMNIGIYYLDNNSAGQWTDLSTNMPKVAVNDLEIQKSGGLLMVGTYGRGLWQRALFGGGAPPVVAITAPINNATSTPSGNIMITASASDSDGTISKVEFFQGSTKLGEDLVAPFSFTWNNVTTGTYSLTAKATDNSGLFVISTPVNFNVIVNCPGSTNLSQASLSVVSFDSQGSSELATNAIDNNPATIWHTKWSGGADPLPHEIQLSLGSTYNVNSFTYLPRQDASQNGRVGQYEIYVSTDAMKWGTPVATGTFVNDANEKVVSFTQKQGSFVRFRALSEVNGNQWTTAAELKVGICNLIINQAPIVSIASPVDNTSFVAPAQIVIDVTANDADGTVSKVEFFQGTTKIGEDVTAPYNFEWNAVATGNYSLTAIATDNAGAKDTSSVIAVSVNPPNISPTVSITSPSNNASFIAPANITINATANDTDGTVSKVEFYQGSTKLGEDTTAPYSFVWNNVVGGTYVLTAKAIDNLEGVATSTAVNITLNTITNLGATADSYVRNGSAYTNSNFGTLTSLTIKNDLAPYTREVYLKFNLNTLPSNFQSAKLRLYVGAANTGVTGTNWKVYYVPTDSWTETGINWNNKPSFTTDLATTAGKAAGNFVEWDITAQTLTEMGVDGILSLKIVSAVAGTTSDASFSSREAATNQPQLVVIGQPAAPANSFNKQMTKPISIIKPDLHEIIVYPNPARDILNISLKNYDGRIETQIFDLQGRMLMKNILRDGNTSLDISRLNSGVFLLKIINHDKITTIKFIKE